MSLHMVKAGRQASPRPRRDLPILPFAEIYTVINLVSIDLEAVCARLEEHKAPAGIAPAGRARHLPGLGHPLIPPWHVAESGPDGVTMQGHFTRCHVGGNGAVRYHCSATGTSAWSFRRGASRQHVDYRKITPTDDPLESRAWIDSVDGRKAFIRAKMTDSDDNVLSEASGLMIKLLPHQP
jgi:hypothetical protein